MDDAPLEPSATQSTPEDIEVDVDTPYGPSTPVLPREPPEETEEDDGPESKPQPQTSPRRGKNLRIPGELLLVILAVLAAGGTGAGILLERTKEKPAQNTGRQTTTPRKEGSRTNFGTDRGIYKRDLQADAAYMLNARIELAKSQIIVVTGEPGNRRILDALSLIKNQKGVTVIILTGKETSEAEIQLAKDYGFWVYQCAMALERPYTIVLIDKRMVLDISRENWLWETTEPKILNQVVSWAEEISKDAIIP
jgi:hypothetical protein